MANFDFNSCVWKDLTIEELDEKLQPMIKYIQEYLKTKREEDIKPKHNYDDNGIYLIFTMEVKDPPDPEFGLEKLFTTGEFRFPQMSFGIKNLVYPGGLKDFVKEYFISDKGYPSKSRPDLLIVKKKSGVI